MAILVIVFGAILVAAVFGAALLPALRLVFRLVLAASISLLAAVIFGGLITGGGENQVPLTLLIMMALFVPTCLLMSRKTATDRSVSVAQSLQPRVPASSGQKRPLNGNPWFPRWLGRRHSEPSLQSSLEKLAEATDQSEARVFLIHRSLVASEAAFAAARLDFEAIDRLIVLRKRVPELINLCLARIGDGSARHCAELLDDLLDLLESVAADCERMRARPHANQDAAYLALKRRIEESLASKSFSPCK